MDCTIILVQFIFFMNISLFVHEAQWVIDDYLTMRTEKTIMKELPSSRGITNSIIINYIEPRVVNSSLTAFVQSIFGLSQS